MDTRETLTSRLYSGLRNKLYTATALAGIGLASIVGSSLYSPIRAQVVTRIIETEPFNSETTLTKSNVRYPDDYPSTLGASLKHWSVNKGLFVSDYQGSSGILIYTTNDKLYPIQKKSISITATFNSPANETKQGIVFAGDPISGGGGTYYEFLIDTAGGSVLIGRRSPGEHQSYFNTTSSTISPNKDNTLHMRFNNTNNTFKDSKGRSIWPGFNFFVNDEKILTQFDDVDTSHCRDDVPSECAISSLIIDPKRCEKINEKTYSCQVDCDVNVNCITICQADPDTGDLMPKTCEEIDPKTCEFDATKCPHKTYDYLKDVPNLEGYVGLLLNDQRVGSDDSTSTYLINNLTVEYDQPAPLGAGAGLENKLVPHIPKVFLRGDSNGDKTFDISDPINTLNYLFTGEAKIKCLDAADANDDGQIDLSDAIYSLSFQFLGGKPLPPPNLGGEGIDLTEDYLTDCESDFNWWK